MPPPVFITAAVEGDVDEAVARRLIVEVGAQPGSVYGKQGKPALRSKIEGFNHAAKHSLWMILVDLNGADCAAALRQEWLPTPAGGLCFRVAVRQIESWLMADGEMLAAYLGVARSKIPVAPETLPNAKIALVNIARFSRRRDVRLDMVPREGSGRDVGAAYTSRMIEYAETRWRPSVAAHRSDSLRRALKCLTQLVKVHS